MKNIELLPEENERILMLIHKKTGGNQLEFSKTIKISQPRISRLFLKNDKLPTKFPLPSFSIIQAIAKAYRDVSLEWLVLGNGEMFKENSKVEKPTVLIDQETEKKLNAYEEQIELLKTLIDTQKKLIETLLPEK